MRDPTRETLRGQLQQVQRRRAEKQELTGAEARTTVVVDHYAECLEEFRYAMHFVEHHQPRRLSTKKGIGVVHPSRVSRLSAPARDRLGRSDASIGEVRKGRP